MVSSTSSAGPNGVSRSGSSRESSEVPAITSIMVAASSRISCRVGIARARMARGPASRVENGRLAMTTKKCCRLGEPADEQEREQHEHPDGDPQPEPPGGPHGGGGGGERRQGAGGEVDVDDGRHLLRPGPGRAAEDQQEERGGQHAGHVVADGDDHRPPGAELPLGEAGEQGEQPDDADVVGGLDREERAEDQRLELAVVKRRQPVGDVVVPGLVLRRAPQGAESRSRASA